MIDFEPVDEAEWSDLRAFGPVEAHRRRIQRQEAAQGPAKPRRARRPAKAGKAAQRGTGPRSVAASDLEPGMVPAVPGGLAIEGVCADLEPPHDVRYWLEGDDDLAYVFAPDELVELEA